LHLQQLAGANSARAAAARRAAGTKVSPASMAEARDDAGSSIRAARRGTLLQSAAAALSASGSGVPTDETQLVIESLRNQVCT
jgi:hypothetical protein